MRVAITGGRHRTPTQGEMARFWDARRACAGTVLLHGAYPGPDGTDLWVAAHVADEGYAVEPYAVDHALDGPWPGAGPRRNLRMLAGGRADVLVPFPGGRGTKDCTEQAIKLGLPIFSAGETAPEPSQNRLPFGAVLILLLLFFLAGPAVAQFSGLRPKGLADKSWKASAATSSALPLTGNTSGDKWWVEDTRTIWEWVCIGSPPECAWHRGLRDIPPLGTVASLGACVPSSPMMIAVTDALSVFDCAVGGGGADAMCICRNGTWSAFGNAGGGTVISAGTALSGLPWLGVSGSPVTTAGTATIAPATGQTPGLVIGTCGTATAFSPCALTSGMIPSLAYLPDSTAYAASATPGGAASSVAAGSITNTSVSGSAGIVESKLALNNPTHPNNNDPTAGQKAALAGTNGTPGAGNPFVTETDPRNSDARTPVSHAHAAADITSGIFDPSRLASGTPTGSTFAAGDGVWKVPPTNTGPQGAPGVNGATWLFGTAAPPSGQGANGDFYYRTSTGDVYGKAAGAWSILANITGPQGTTGATGPSGPQGPAGDPASSPETLPGLVIWLRADTLVATLNDGDPVGSWPDDSGNSHTFTQSSPAGKPLFKTNLLESHPAVRFDGVNDCLTNSSVGLSTFSIFMVFKSPEGSAAGLLYEQGADINSHSGIAATNGTNITVSVNHSGGSTFSDRNYQGTSPSSAFDTWGRSGLWRIFLHSYGGTHSTHRFGIDGAFPVQLSTGGGHNVDQGTDTTTDEINLGCRHNASVYVSMDLAEWIVFSPQLSAPQERAVARYIQAKFNL